MNVYIIWHSLIFKASLGTALCRLLLFQFHGVATIGPAPLKGLGPAQPEQCLRQIKTRSLNLRLLRPSRLPLPHPDHLAFVEILKPVLDDVLVLDYTV